LGLYQPMTAGIGALDMGVVLPLFAGILLVAFAFARPANWMLEHRYSLLFHVILGVVIASTVMLVLSVFPFKDTWEVIFGIGLILAGIVAALALERFNEGVKRRHEIA